MAYDVSPVAMFLYIDQKQWLSGSILFGFHLKTGKWKKKTKSTDADCCHPPPHQVFKADKNWQIVNNYKTCQRNVKNCKKK